MEKNKKNLNAYAFLHEEIDKHTKSLISEEYNYQDANYYNLLELDNYELVAFDLSEDFLEAFHIQSPIKLKY